MIMLYYCHPSIGSPSYSLPNLNDWRTGCVSKGIKMCGKIPLLCSYSELGGRLLDVNLGKRMKVQLMWKHWDDLLNKLHYPKQSEDIVLLICTRTQDH